MGITWTVIPNQSIQQISREIVIPAGRNHWSAAELLRRRFLQRFLQQPLVVPALPGCRGWVWTSGAWFTKRPARGKTCVGGDPLKRFPGRPDCRTDAGRSRRKEVNLERPHACAHTHTLRFIKPESSHGVCFLVQVLISSSCAHIWLRFFVLCVCFQEVFLFYVP